MKPVSDIRRQNLAALLAQEGTQAGLAAKLGKDKNQIYQWLLATGTEGARNIGPRSARHIELTMGKPEGWLDHEDAAHSQPVQRDLEKLARAVEWVRWAAKARKQPFTPQKEAELLEGVYAALTRPDPANLVELGVWLNERAGSESERQDDIGSVDEDGAGGVGRQTAG